MTFTEKALQAAIADYFRQHALKDGFCVDPGDEDEEAERLAQHVYAALKGED